MSIPSDNDHSTPPLRLTFDDDSLVALPSTASLLVASSVSPHPTLFARSSGSVDGIAANAFASTSASVPGEPVANGGRRSSLTMRAGSSLDGRVKGEQLDAADEVTPTKSTPNRDIPSKSRSTDTANGAASPDSTSSSLASQSSASSFQQRSISPSAALPPPHPPVAARLGNWFSNILNASSSSNNNNNAASYPSSTRLSFSSSHTTEQQPIPTRISHRQSVSSTFSSFHASSPSHKSSKAPATNPGRLDRMLDRAVQFFLDSDSAADRCSDPIWVLGVRHDGFSDAAVVIDSAGDDSIRSSSSSSSVSSSTRRMSRKLRSKRQTAASDSRSSSSTHVLSESGSESLYDKPLPNRPLSSSSRVVQRASTFPATTNGWPTIFYSDFYSRIALTYRSSFPPIPCSAPLTAASTSTGMSGVMHSLSVSMGRSTGRTSEGLSSDTGWGCMLRTGQSLLANALLSVHLGRDWRKELPETDGALSSTEPQHIASRAIYSRLLSLFIDDPSPLAPFSVHRFATMGHSLFGKEVGEWFGPSTAAGTIKVLVNEYEGAGLGVVVGGDGVIYRSEVEKVGRWDKAESSRPVLVLLGVRLGIDGVNPVYWESVKSTFSFSQSVGIAGGRPSSSYYFVGSQANSLFYLDPHHPRAAIPLRFPTDQSLIDLASSLPLGFHKTTSTDDCDRIDSFFSQAYTDEELDTYHCDKVRKMALRNLDPSMLLGFLIKDRQDWIAFETSVTEIAKHHSPIFSLADSPPKWMNRSSPASPSSHPDGVNTSIANGAAGSGTDDDDWDIETASERESIHVDEPLLEEEREHDGWSQVAVDRSERQEESWHTALPSPVARDEEGEGVLVNAVARDA